MAEIDDLIFDDLTEKESSISSYIPPDFTSMSSQWNKGIEGGEKSFVHELDEVLRWKKGFVNGWYGWPSDGKGTMFDYLSLMKSRNDGTKWCLFKQEDMSSHRGTDKKVRIDANQIYNNLIWTHTGISPYKHVAQKYMSLRGSMDDYREALEWVEQHFFVVYMKDRKFTNVMNVFREMHKEYGINGFLIDPWKSIILEDGNSVDDKLNLALIQCKEFALETESYFNIIAHPKSQTDVKDKEGKYKVVNQYMVAGGAMWDNNLDGQFSIYRNLRHADPRDNGVHFHCLKQRDSDVVGSDRGVYQNIKLDRRSRRYYFDMICPITGARYMTDFERKMHGVDKDYRPDSQIESKTNPDELPF